MKVLALASRKGGSGKTTLAGHLAVQAERQGSGPVALIDVDPQGSLTEWWNARAAEAPQYVQTNLRRLSEDVAALRRHGVKLLVIDTPPALGNAIQTVVGLADLVLIPARPSPHDLRSVGATVEIVERMEKPLVFVINAATHNARITLETVSMLSDHGPLAPAVIHQRVDFASSMIDGRTVMELAGTSRASQEVAKLWNYIERRLDGAKPRIGLTSNLSPKAVPAAAVGAN